MNEILNKSSFFIEFDYIKKGKKPELKHAKFQIGDSKDDIRFSLIEKIIEISKKGSKSANSFTDYLANEMYASLNASEKQLVQILTKDLDSSALSPITNLEVSVTSASLTNQNNTSAIKALSNIEIRLKEEKKSVTDYEIKVGSDEFDEYLNDLKLAEEYTFKLKEENKYRKKMEKISGITPMDEMMVEMAGTSVKPSNMHHTDWHRLNDHKINSPSFV